MRIDELLKFSAFRGADIIGINMDEPNASISFTDEIVNITNIEVVCTGENVDGIIRPERHLRVFCVVKR